MNKQVQDSNAVPDGSTDDFGQHQAASYPPSNSQSLSSPVHKLKIGKRATEEVNAIGKFEGKGYKVEESIRV